MDDQQKAIDSLKEKLKTIGNPTEIEVLEIKISKNEAEVYDIESNDILSTEDILRESEGENE